MSYSAGYKDDIFLRASLSGRCASDRGLHVRPLSGSTIPGSVTTANVAAVGSSFGYNNDPRARTTIATSSTARARTSAM